MNQDFCELGVYATKAHEGVQHHTAETRSGKGCEVGAYDPRR